MPVDHIETYDYRVIKKIILTGVKIIKLKHYIPADYFCISFDHTYAYKYGIYFYAHGRCHKLFDYI